MTNTELTLQQLIGISAGVAQGPNGETCTDYLPINLGVGRRALKGFDRFKRAKASLNEQIINVLAE
tara:strand:+ start:259 stop:456 length:198 start_codon:yes stop_codon:yes gene_type:complete